MSPQSSGTAPMPEESQRSPEDEERVAAWRRGEAHSVGAGGLPTASGSAEAGSRAAAVDRAFAAFAENVRDYAIFLMDPSGTITFWGEGARRIKGWTKAEAEGAHLRLLYPPGGSEDGTAEAHLAHAAEHGEYTGEGPRIRSNGGSFWATVAITALRDETGTLLGFAKLSRDLTARRAEDALRLATAEAAEVARRAEEAASAAKNGFLATISHEIRTPVNAILGYTALLEMELDGPLTAAQRRHLDAARKSGRQLLALIAQVLDFSHLERAARGDAEHATAPVPLGPIVADAVALVASSAAERNVELVDAVGASPLVLTAWGDAAGVRQILDNLLDNALRFGARSGGNPARITVRGGLATHGPVAAELRGAGPWVFHCVEDTGLGIPADRLEAVFEPFVQGDMRLTRTHGGLGLGLAISRRLARRMGGALTVQSETGVGSAFFLWLPDRAGAPAEPAGRAATGLRIAAASGSDREDWVPAAAAVAVTEPFRAVADALRAGLDRIMHGYVARLRTDLGTPSAHALDEAQLEDHVAALLGNLVSTLPSLAAAALDTAQERASLTPEDDMRDGAIIQRVVTERHGAQRARLGWSEAELRREHTILREEITAAILRQAPRALPTLTVDAARHELSGALTVLTEFLSTSERLSLGAYHAAISALRASPPETAR